MKTYCKPAAVNIEDWEFNVAAVVDCFRNKRGRSDFQRLLCKTGSITKRELAEDRLNNDFTRTMQAEVEVANMVPGSPHEQLSRKSLMHRRISSGMVV